MVQVLNKTKNGFFAYVSNPHCKYGVMGIESAKNLFDDSQVSPKVLRIFEVGSDAKPSLLYKHVDNAPMKAEMIANILDSKKSNLTKADIAEIYRSVIA